MKPRTEVPLDIVEDVPVEPATVSDPGPSASAPEPPGKAAQVADAPSAAPSVTPALSLWRSMPNCWHSAHMLASAFTSGPTCGGLCGCKSQSTPKSVGKIV